MQRNDALLFALIEPGHQVRCVGFARLLVAGNLAVILVVDDGESAGKRDAVRAERVLQRGHILVGSAGCGDGLRLNAGIVGHILGQFLHHAGGVVAQFRSVGREPAVDGAVHQLKAEQKHQHRGGKGDERRAQHHARAQPGAEGAAALVGVELEDVPQQQQQQDDQQQEQHHREPGKRQRLAGCFGVQEADAGGVEPLQSAQQREEKHHSQRKQEHGAPPAILTEEHGAIIVPLAARIERHMARLHRALRDDDREDCRRAFATSGPSLRGDAMQTRLPRFAMSCLGEHRLVIDGGVPCCAGAKPPSARTPALHATISSTPAKRQQERYVHRAEKGTACDWYYTYPRSKAEMQRRASPQIRHVLFAHQHGVTEHRHHAISRRAGIFDAPPNH